MKIDIMRIIQRVCLNTFENRIKIARVCIPRQMKIRTIKHTEKYPLNVEYCYTTTVVRLKFH